MKNIYKYFIPVVVAALSCGTYTSCSLEEDDPGGFTFENMSQTPEGFQTLVNQIYFGLERSFYGNINKIDFMAITEAESDLWTTPRNLDNTYQQYCWFFAGGAPNTTYTLNFLYSLYDGIGSCNKVLQFINLPKFNTDAERNAKAAEARFMRALYYYHGVEQFGAITVVTEANTSVGEGTYSPEKMDPIKVYDEIIIPDLEYAVEWLPVGDDNVITRPSKKSAIGLLARAALQATRWTDNKAPYYQKALDNAKLLITDCEAGGATYNTYMYPNFADVFNEANNLNNREALWKHSYFASGTYNGSSNGAHILNMCHTIFRCQTTQFPARENNAESYVTLEGSVNGYLMPTQHLISLFVNDDNTLDPRFALIFQNKWNANKAYTWTGDIAAKFDKDTTVVKGQTINVGDMAIEFVMPQDADYATKVAAKSTSTQLIVDYADVYDDAGKTIKLKHAYTNTTPDYKADGSNENFLSYFYPSLTKYNSSNFFESNASKMRFGNLDAMLIIRMPEMYFIAAEADIALNGAANAMGYINKVRNRAGATALAGTATVRTVLDERGRELCGEFQRYYDLARTGMLKDATYLQETNPSLAQYFNVNYVLRPFDTSTFLPSINNGDEYQNTGY
ncbi:MAG: RagB/SusD family nutrient uptake outer membrane protein [Bacteroidales bacterium]|nr:RagB/SusD family nutrient uptake outer membrane protein [Bacteroidales bacterium]